MAHGTTASDVVLFLKREVAVCKDLLLELKLALSDAHVDENTQSAVFEEIQLFARRCMSAMREQCDASLQHWRSGGAAISPILQPARPPSTSPYGFFDYVDAFGSEGAFGAERARFPFLGSALL